MNQERTKREQTQQNNVVLIEVQDEEIVTTNKNKNKNKNKKN